MRGKIRRDVRGGPGRASGASTSSVYATTHRQSRWKAATAVRGGSAVYGGGGKPGVGIGVAVTGTGTPDHTPRAAEGEVPKRSSLCQARGRGSQMTAVRTAGVESACAYEGGAEGGGMRVTPASAPSRALSRRRGQSRRRALAGAVGAPWCAAYWGSLSWRPTHQFLRDTRWNATMRKMKPTARRWGGGRKVASGGSEAASGTHLVTPRGRP